METHVQSYFPNGIITICKGDINNDKERFWVSISVANGDVQMQFYTSNTIPLNLEINSYSLRVTDDFTLIALKNHEYPKENKLMSDIKGTQFYLSFYDDEPYIYGGLFSQRFYEEQLEIYILNYRYVEAETEKKIKNIQKYLKGGFKNFWIRGDIYLNAPTFPNYFKNKEWLSNSRYWSLKKILG